MAGLRVSCFSTHATYYHLPVVRVCLLVSLQFENLCLESKKRTRLEQRVYIANVCGVNLVFIGLAIARKVWFLHSARSNFHKSIHRPIRISSTGLAAATLKYLFEHLFGSVHLQAMGLKSMIIRTRDTIFLCTIYLLAALQGERQRNGESRNVKHTQDTPTVAGMTSDPITGRRCRPGE